MGRRLLHNNVHQLLLLLLLIIFRPNAAVAASSIGSIFHLLHRRLEVDQSDKFVDHLIEEAIDHVNYLPLEVPLPPFEAIHHPLHGGTHFDDQGVQVCRCFDFEVTAQRRE